MRRPHRLLSLARHLAIALTVFSAVTSSATPTEAREITALVPAYFYPTWWAGSPWDDLNAAAARIPVEAIMNPASGPGAAANPDYQFAVGQLQAAGGKVIGYVATGYGVAYGGGCHRRCREIPGLVRRGRHLPGRDGQSAGDLDYAALYADIKTIGAELHVVGNPGIPFTQVEALVTAADTLVIFEGPLENADPFGANFRMYPDQGPYTGLPPWFLDYDSSKFGNLVYDVSTPAEMFGALIKAIIYNADYVYVTDDVLNNPWDTLPRYWEQEVNLIEFLNCFL